MPDFIGDPNDDGDINGYVPNTRPYAIPHKRPRSAAAVQFRVVVYEHTAGGFLPVTTGITSREVAETAASLFIRSAENNPDDKVVVQSSYTAPDGTVAWHDQTVVQWPRGAKWKQYCETHEFCGHCGQVVQKGGVACGLVWSGLQRRN